VAERINEVQRNAILPLLAQGLDRKAIAYQVGVTPGQVSAVAAHVKMGTYTLPGPGVSPMPPTGAQAVPVQRPDVPQAPAQSEAPGRRASSTGFPRRRRRPRRRGICPPCSSVLMVNQVYNYPRLRHRARRDC